MRLRVIVATLARFLPGKASWMANMVKYKVAFCNSSVVLCLADIAV